MPARIYVHHGVEMGVWISARDAFTDYRVWCIAGAYRSGAARQDIFGLASALERQRWRGRSVTILPEAAQTERSLVHD